MDKKKMKDYEVPFTKKTQVELEGSICASANIQNPNEESGRIEEHKINDTFDGDFSENSWDE